MLTLCCAALPPAPQAIRETFTPLVEKCKSLNRAIRIGTNHGSLSARILSYYGAPRCARCAALRCACYAALCSATLRLRLRLGRPSLQGSGASTLLPLVSTPAS